ncbi:MAG: hypothetical protein Fur0032_20580 [Terrimicrobiaceae bacterium]
MKTLSWAGLLIGLAILASPASDSVIDAADLEALRAAAGTEVKVAGHVVDIGTTSDNRITFLNLSLPKKQGFTAVIFEENYGAFPDGFAQFKGQKVEVSGVIDLFRGNLPQIKLRSPDQIRILEASTE